MICDELSDADIQYFAVIANGEFIKTNALPTTPEPSDWLDLVDQAAANILNWKFGALLALGLAACCAVLCACRRCERNRRHVVLQNKYSRSISANRGAVSSGRKHRPAIHRPQPYAFPVRAPGDPSAVGSGRFQESWRRPGPSSEHSRRSMRSGHSARGALLTGAGAVVPAGIDSEATTPPTPPHETCPECGLRLPDVCKLVNHVETHHGGRAIRKKETAGAVEVGTRAGGAKAEAKTGEKAAGRRGESLVVASAKDARKASPPHPAERGRERGRGSPNARNARAARSSSKTRSKSPAPTRQAHVSAVRSSTAAAVSTAVAVGTMVVTAVPASRRKATAPPAEPPSRSYPDPAAAAAAAGASSSATKSRSRSPGNSGSGRSGSGRSGSSSAKTSSASPGSSDPAAAAPTRGRDALPRLKDISGHGNSKHSRDQDSSGHGSGGSSDPLPRVLPRVKDRGKSAGGDSDELPRILSRVKDGSGHGTSKDRKNSGSAGASRRTSDGGDGAAASKLPATKTDHRQGPRREAAGAGSRGTRAERNGSSPPLENNRNGGSGGSRSRGTSRERGGTGSRGTSRERGRPSNAGKGKSSEERGRSRGRSRQRSHAPALDDLRGLAREDSTRSLARTASLDRMSALSSRALTRLNKGNGEGDAAVGSGGAGASGGGKGTAARKKEEALSRRGIRRVASTEDMVPAGQRLTADRLKLLGSGLAADFTVPPPVFSPVKGSGKEPAYSPVARDRAAELDEERPLSLTRKFFRQLSGEL